MTEESMMILNLLRDGKISATEAERLLRAVREAGTPAPAAAPLPPPSALGQAAQSATKLAGRAFGLIPKPKFDTGKMGEKVSAAADDALRAAKSAARDVASEVSKLSQQTKDALHFDAPSVFAPETGRPANDSGQPQASDAAQTEVAWSGAERLALVNRYGSITVTGHADLVGMARATVMKTAWAATDEAARLMLQQTFLVSRVENGTCRVEVVVPSDAAGRVTVDYEIFVPQDMALEAQTTFGGIEAAGTSSAFVAKSQSGRLTVRHPSAETAGEGRLTTASGDILLDGWNVPMGSLRVETQSGDVECQNVHCGRDLTASSRSGDIAVTGGSAGTRLRVETQSGNLRLTDMRAEDVEVEGISGGITLKSIAGRLVIKSASGPVLAAGLQTPAMSLHVSSGDAALAFAAPFSESLAATSVSGDIIVSLWDNSNTRIEMSAVSGELSCALPLEDAEGDRQRRLAGRLGDAIGSIKLQSVSGDLRIEKETPPKRRTRGKSGG